MKKKKQMMNEKRDRILVPIYENEFDVVADKLKLADVNSGEIRIALGLKRSGRTIGLNSQIRMRLSEKLKAMSSDDKKDMLDRL